eukprot:gnl/MRDRNA2_/MRDRNA2_115335_c0_seq1.p1 gnl/MRDRNA2_/MRDRNA2_115335_c0~~gnl/MRDRNA2_/MRDRNA2_115335_c0_seq1.p1  ORF type:complete len:871 (+),score=186.02 gnl/MRDRNA2_/MRDRNA2_115335_c0_seq1:102-2615(+)
MEAMVGDIIMQATGCNGIKTKHLSKSPAPCRDSHSRKRSNSRSKNGCCPAPTKGSRSSSTKGNKTSQCQPPSKCPPSGPGASRGRRARSRPSEKQTARPRSLSQHKKGTEITILVDRPCSPVTEEPKMETEEEVDELPIVAAELIGTVLEDSVERLAFFCGDEDNESTYSVEDVDGSLRDDDDVVEEANVPLEVAMKPDVIAKSSEESDQVSAVFLQSSFCEKATFEEGDASWGSWAPSHDLFGDRPFERYFQSFGHASVLQVDSNVPSLASMEMDQPCLGPCEEEFAMEGCLTEDFVNLVGAMENDISANLAACKIQWAFQMMQEWRQIQLQQWEMRAMAVNRGVRCQDQAASKIQHAWREMQIWRQVQLRLWEQRADALNGAVRCPHQAAGQIQRAFCRFRARRQEAIQKTKQRFEAERSFSLQGAESLAQVLCPEVDFGRSALDSAGIAVGARSDELDAELDAEELANVWASFCSLYTLAKTDAATAIQKAWRSHRQNKRPMLLQATEPPRICCPITRMLEAMKALQDAAREDAVKRIQKQYRATRSAMRARSATQAAKQVEIESVHPAKTKKGEDEAARCLQQAFRSFKLHKAAKHIRAQFAAQESKPSTVTAALNFTPIPPSAPKEMNSRRPSTRASRMTIEAPTTPSTKCQQRPYGRKAGPPSTQASSASASAPISPAAAETRLSETPRRRPTRIHIPESFKLDDPKSSPLNATGTDISNEFAALGSEIFNIGTPRSKGSRSTTSPMAWKSPRSLGATLSAESPRWSRNAASNFSKRAPSLGMPSQEPMSPRTPRGSTRAGALLPDITMAQRSSGQNTARMLEAITKKTMM